ncbi:MAG: acetyl-CoA carboxylase biotin carboxyl carrier protein [Planctomycetota bacterium]
MAGSSKKPADVFDLDRLNQLIELMKEHGLTEVDLQQEEQKIKLARGGSAAPMMAAPMAPAAPATAASATPAAAAADDANIVTINSPMVGTFYCKPNPDSPSFVSVGDNIGSDTIVCIIEAMKVFNEIPAEVKGQVVAVLCENEESVEFGKPLFKVDTSK